ncbi:MAG TPA: DUF5996 family protein [Steroidobacteraceae bacterium]
MPGWPELSFPQWETTAATLHMYTQIVGKTRLALTPRQNHWWNVALMVTVRGISTGAMPLLDGGLLEIEFDFVGQRLTFSRSDGRTESLPLHAQSVASFFRSYKAALGRLEVRAAINPMPVEVKDPIRFDLDEAHKSYDPDAAQRFWHVLGNASTVFKDFGTGFYGKVSPVHFFWGSFDLAVTRFNGKRAPPHAGADAIQAEAYSHECISVGFWPGNGGYGQAAFYAYIAPVPQALHPAPYGGPGTFNQQLGEFILNYNEARAASNPRARLLEFLQKTYAVCANVGGWDRAELDRKG